MKSKKDKKRKMPGYLLFDFVRFTGALPALIWYRVKKIYENDVKPPKMKGMLICSNHLTWADPVLLMCTFWNRRLSFVATSDLFSSKLSNFFFTHIHCIPVDRENFNMKTFHQVKDELNNGKAVGIFPEGKVNCGDPQIIQPFKSGAVLMAYQCNAPILPVYIVPKVSWIKRRKIVIGQPINVREVCGDNPTMSKINECCELLRQKEEDLENYYLRRKYEKRIRKVHR